MQTVYLTRQQILMLAHFLQLEDGPARGVQITTTPDEGSSCSVAYVDSAGRMRAVSFTSGGMPTSIDGVTL